jgi:hypothetical protein
MLTLGGEGMALADSHQLFSIKGGLPGGSKQKKEVAQEIAKMKNCDEALISVTAKPLAEYLSPIRNHQNAARKELGKHGLPWTSPWVLIANNDVDVVVPKLEALKQENWEMWRGFMDIYTQVVDRKRMEMGTFFDPGDFPDIDKLKVKWKFEILRDVVPDPEYDIRAGWSYKQITEMKEVMERQQEDNLKEATLELLRRARGPLLNVVDKCNRYEGGRAGRFSTETFIGNVRSVVDQMVSGNLTDDPDVESLRREILKEICSLTAQEIREDESLRKETGKLADSLVKKTDKIIERVSTFGAGITI